ncbi:MAG: hypothetical protein EPO21_11865 [Chloroflexota bacterium]|nr:MAG: hypothetical protein EPO21_11865 [Chloroflexota bacterium]
MRENALTPRAPSNRVRALLESAVPRILERAGTRGLLTLAVVGSAARGEETWSGEKLVGDIDLAAVVRWPDPWTRHRFERAANGFHDAMGLGCFPLYSLRRYRTLEFYEAKKTAWVVWGQPDVFDRVRVAQAQDIPKWEGLRLLLNRAVDCLRARAELIPGWYAAVKAYLALGEADLIFADRYVPSYRARGDITEVSGVVLGSAALFERFHWATRVKLGEEPPPDQFTSREHERWLIEGIASLTSRYLGQSVTVPGGLELLSRRIGHPEHRGLYIAQHIRHPRQCAPVLRRDPAFVVWGRALAILSGEKPTTARELAALISDFGRVLQPLPR